MARLLDVPSEMLPRIELVAIRGGLGIAGVLLHLLIFIQVCARPYYALAHGQLSDVLERGWAVGGGVRCGLADRERAGLTTRWTRLPTADAK